MMKINTNYLNVFKKKEKTIFPFMKGTLIDKILKNIKISKRQKFWGVISLLLIGVSYVMKAIAQPVIGVVTGDYNRTDESFRNMGKVIGEMFNTGEIKLSNTYEAGQSVVLSIQQDLVRNFSGIDLLKKFLKWIANIQVSSIDKVNELAFGTRDMFGFLVDGLTIFAVIGCLYKLIMHFLNTERHDNVKAYTGYFQYLSIAVLFAFSDQIVDRVVGLNQKINSKEIMAMTQKLDHQLDVVLKNDLQRHIKALKILGMKMDGLIAVREGETFGVGSGIELLKTGTDVYKILIWDANFALVFKYIYFTTFISILCSIMALPAFIISVMVKILLTVMVAGTKLVFLLAFIPGFENTWKTFMLNMLNILLWVPIFNAIYSFVVALVISMMSDVALSNGQIVWLTLVSVILAFQTLTLTTSAAGVVINGAGASMAGAMGSMATMGGVQAATGIAKAAVGVASTAVGIGMAAKGASTLGNISKSLSNIEKHMQK